MLYRETPSSTDVFDSLPPSVCCDASIPAGLVKRTNGQTPTIAQSTLADTRSAYGISTLARSSAPVCECFSPALQSTKIWRAEKKAEKSAFKYIPEVPMPWAPCEFCGIYIGPGYIEKEAYFFFVRDRTLKLSDETAYDIGPEGALFVICGGCAKFHLVPESEKLIDHEDWASMRYVHGHLGEQVRARTPEERVQAFEATVAHLARLIEERRPKPEVTNDKKKKKASHAKKKKKTSPPQEAHPLPPSLPEAMPVLMVMGSGMCSTTSVSHEEAMPLVPSVTRSFSFL